jgi:exodeoxyribonuclease VIII
MNNPIDLDALFSLAPATAVTKPVMPVSAARIDGVTPGCYAMEISDADYHTKCVGASSSALKTLLRSPSHYRAYLDEDDKDTSARMFGRAVHALLLERHLFLDKFAIWTEGRRHGKKFDEFAATHAGKTILTEDEHHRAMEAALALRNQDQFPLGLWLDGVPAHDTLEAVPPARTEFSIFWVDEETGLPCKIRVDAHGLVPSPLAMDIKTTDDSRTSSFMHQLFRLHYDLQAAHYRAGLRAFYGVEFPFLFGVVEDKAPYACNVVGCSQTTLENGERKRRHALGLLKQCQDANQWPGYPHKGVEEVDLPHFYQFKPDFV